MKDADKDDQQTNESAHEGVMARRAEEAAEAHERWRKVGVHLSKAALARVESLAGSAREEGEDDRTIREFSAVVLSAQRAMEMEHHYEQKVQPCEDGEDAGDIERRRREDLARAESFARRMLAERFGAGNQEGVSQK